MHPSSVGSKKDEFQSEIIPYPRDLTSEKLPTLLRTVSGVIGGGDHEPEPLNATYLFPDSPLCALVPSVSGRRE